MAGKSMQQRVAEADQRIRQLQARKQALEQRLRQQERKARTRRLIQIGAVMSNMGVDTLEKVQALQKQVERRPEVREWIARITGSADPS